MLEELFGNIQTQLILLLRVVVASFCGMLIGFERKRRKKEAGVRTHTIVAGGAALFTSLSIFAFPGGDTARIAAQIVTGIGFLGAGMIIVRRESLFGLTTAAGIWATAGFGMAVGAGYYVAGVLSTLFFVSTLLVFGYFKVFQSKPSMTVVIEYDPAQLTPEDVQALFKIKEIRRSRITGASDRRAVSQTFQVYDRLTASSAVALVSENPGILSIDVLED